MMKQFYLLLNLVLVSFFVYAQDYEITFVGTGEVNTVDTVQIDNLTQCESYIINGSSTLVLTNSFGIEQHGDNSKNTLKIYPNPMKGKGFFSFYAKESGNASIEIYDINGRLLHWEKQHLSEATHTFSIQGLGTGIFLIKVNSNNYSFVGKLISKNQTSESVRIFHKSNSDEYDQIKSQKVMNSVNDIPYNDGDILRFIGKSGKYTAIVTAVPDDNTQIVFNFVECTNYENIDYPTVQIGRQLWMAKNLMSTYYPDGDTIELVEENTYWDSLGGYIPAYCYYENDILNKEQFGVLYNWEAAMDGKASSTNNPSRVQGVCPDGWHLPSNAEWEELMGYIGRDSLSGEDIMETCTDLWNYPNSNVTNSTGFTGLPGGYRADTGTYNYKGEVALFWTSTQSNSMNGRYYGLSSDSLMLAHNIHKNSGLSLRCVKNYEIGTYDDPSMELALVKNNLAFIGDQYDGTKIINLTNFDSIYYITNIPSQGQLWNVVDIDPYVLSIERNGNNSYVLDISNPEMPVVELIVPDAHAGYAITNNNSVFFSRRYEGYIYSEICVDIWNFIDPLNPYQEALVQTGINDEAPTTHKRKIFVWDNYLYITRIPNIGCLIYDISNISSPILVDSIENYAYNIYVNSDFITLFSGKDIAVYSNNVGNISLITSEEDLPISVTGDNQNDYFVWEDNEDGFSLLVRKNSSNILQLISFDSLDETIKLELEHETPTDYIKTFFLDEQYIYIASYTGLIILKRDYMNN